jgi:hypothetical protein
MDKFWEYALFALSAITLGIVGNLLTPYVRVGWARLSIWRERGFQAQLRQQIKVVERDLDDHNRLSSSTHDLLILLFQILLGVFALFVLASTCAFIAASTDVSQENRQELFEAALLLWILSATLSFVFVVKCSSYRESGAKKRRAALEAQLSKLKSQLEATK